MKLCIALVLAVELLIGPIPEGFGQPPGNQFSVQSFHKNYSIPNPNNPLALASLAINPTVAAELELDKEHVSALKKMLREAGGDLSVPHVSYSKAPGKAEPTSEEINAILKDKLAARRSQLDEVLNPEKLSKLKQMAYQIEMARVGLSKALTDGKLGEDIGVHENQKAQILKRGAEIEAKLQEKIKAALAEAQHQLLHELVAEQREKAKELLGTPFYYREDNFRGMDRKRLED